MFLLTEQPIGASAATAAAAAAAVAETSAAAGAVVAAAVGWTNPANHHAGCRPTAARSCCCSPCSTNPTLHDGYPAAKSSMSSSSPGSHCGSDCCRPQLPCRGLYSAMMHHLHKNPNAGGWRCCQCCCCCGWRCAPFGCYCPVLPDSCPFLCLCLCRCCCYCYWCFRCFCHCLCCCQCRLYHCLYLCHLLCLFLCPCPFLADCLGAVPGCHCRPG
mmetsp:Transcript_66984/g.145588  ORF Transcript_66984/g.145588 Transcript_66984/m.145588 type:complete len:215 (+) Transcript_66984:84-728(+)